jgi:hypothetical protein
LGTPCETTASIDVWVTVAVDGHGVAQDVVVGVVEDVLDLETDPVGGDAEVVRLVVHPPSPGAGVSGLSMTAVGSRRTRIMLPLAEPISPRLVLVMKPRRP